MESFVEVFGIVFAVALTLLVTTGVALWLDKLVNRRRVHSRQPLPQNGPAVVSHTSG